MSEVSDTLRIASSRFFLFAIVSYAQTGDEQKNSRYGAVAAPNRYALAEQITDSELSRTTSRREFPEVREHHGNPGYFMKYIIKIPPVYV